MRVTSRFFDVADWSLYASLQTTVVLIVFKLLKVKFELRVFILASLMSMMTGKLIDKMTMAFFLGMLLWAGKKNFLKNVLVVILAQWIIHYLKMENPVYKFINDTQILRGFVFALVALWMIIIGIKMIN